MQLGFFFDQTKCVGCHTCAVACKDWNDLPPGPAHWLRIREIEKGEYPAVYVAWTFNACWHCANPACVTACPVGAITKGREDGIVRVDREGCLGHDKCDLCLQACAYESPQFGPEPNAKMQKCDFCPERIAAGKKPICVAACPLRALDAGPLALLQTLYGKAQEAEGFPSAPHLQPAVVFKPRFHDPGGRRRS